MSWTLIEHQALSSSAASVTLGSGGTIPQTYKTLKLVVSSRVDTTTLIIALKPNGSTSNLNDRYLQGNGSAASSNTDASTVHALANGSGDTANTFASVTFDIPNYTSTTTNKPISVDSVTENNATAAYQRLTAGLWSSTSAITSIVITEQNTGNLVSGSTFTLYGLA